jgi:hypothetical protein
MHTKRQIFHPVTVCLAVVPPSPSNKINRNFCYFPYTTLALMLEHRTDENHQKHHTKNSKNTNNIFLTQTMRLHSNHLTYIHTFHSMCVMCTPPKRSESSKRVVFQKVNCRRRRCRRLVENGMQAQHRK